MIDTKSDLETIGSFGRGCATQTNASSVLSRVQVVLEMESGLGQEKIELIMRSIKSAVDSAH